MQEQGLTSRVAAGACEVCGFVNAVEGQVTRIRCGGCGERVALTFVRASFNGEQPCDDRCQYAVGPVCSCSCDGVNHRRGYIRVDVVPKWVRERDRERHERKRARAEERAEKARVTREQAAEARRVELLERWPVLAGLLDERYADPGKSFLFDMRHAFRCGDMTDRQADAAASALERDRERQVEQEAREQRRDELLAAGVRVPTGRTTFTGRIVSVRDEPNRFGPGRVWRMLVETSQGWRLWGPVPADLRPDDASLNWQEGLRGRTVTLGAHMAVSDRDPLFGFFKRPSVVDAHAEEPAPVSAPECAPVPERALVDAGGGVRGRARTAFPWGSLISQ